MTSLADRSCTRLSPKQLRERLRATRRQQARKARKARRPIDRIHHQLPDSVRTLFDPLGPAFTRPAHHRFVMLALAAILTVGSRTLANLLRAPGALAPGHPPSSPRVFSRDRWSPWGLARRFAGSVLARLVPSGVIELAGDDTAEGRRGKEVFGEGCHRDPVRSTQAFAAYRWGHKRVVLAVLVRLPCAARRRAPPLLVALYQSEDEGRRQGRRPKPPPRLRRQMLRVSPRWLPERTFACTGDGDCATHELAALATRSPGRPTYVSRFYPDANPAAPPPPYGGCGRPRVKGEDLPGPAEAARSATTRPVLEVAWYGGGRRRVAVVTGAGWWYRGGQPLVPPRWAFVRDLAGTRRDEHFFTPNRAMGPAAVIGTYTGRGDIETPFQEMRPYVGLETTRGRSRSTVLRVAPCLFGL
jgi:hypothetical protein